MLIITMLSLGIAAVSGFMAWRVLRADRLRSAARVHSLESAIDGDVLDFDEGAGNEFAWETPALSLTLRGPDDPELAIDDALQQRSSRHRTLLTAASGVVGGIVVIVVMAMFADDHNRPSVPADTAATQPLELLSMTHTRDGGALVVSGLVHNGSHTETAPLTTIVTALDRDGQVVARGSASMTGLGPGKTQPFMVRIDYPGPLGRYRVSFRTSAGVLPHIDRRGAQASPHVVAE
jgi:hypothetical protein